MVPGGRKQGGWAAEESEGTNPRGTSMRGGSSGGDKQCPNSEKRHRILQPLSKGGEKARMGRTTENRETPNDSLPTGKRSSTL